MTGCFHHQNNYMLLSCQVTCNASIIAASCQWEIRGCPSLFFSSFCLPPGVSANLCRVTGGVLGIHWSSVISLGWHPLADGRGGATCWESCCLKPNCNAVWSLGGRCVLLSCTRTGGCPISILPQPHQESLGLLQMLSKVWLPLVDRHAFSDGIAID